MKILHIFGGGPLVEFAIRKAEEIGYRTVVRTGPRFEASIGSPDCDFDLYVGETMVEVMSLGPLPSLGDIGLSLSAPWIIRQDVIDLFGGNLFNLHAQPLPKFRGAGGQSWRILMGDYAGGVSLHQLTSKVDGGEVVKRLSFGFPQNFKLPYEFDNLNHKMSETLLGEWLLEFSANPFKEKGLSNDKSTESEYWPRLSTQDNGWIDWGWSLTDIEIFCRAFSAPYPGAQTFCGKTKVSILSVEIVPKHQYFHPFQQGLIFKIDDRIHVAHRHGVLIIKEWRTDAETQYLRLGDRLYTPSAILESALTTRVQYSPSGKVLGRISNE